MKIIADRYSRTKSIALGSKLGDNLFSRSGVSSQHVSLMTELLRPLFRKEFLAKAIVGAVVSWTYTCLLYGDPFPSQAQQYLDYQWP